MAEEIKALGEKRASLALGGMIFAYGGYFVASKLVEESTLVLVSLFAVATAVRVAIEFGGGAIVAARAPGDARMKPDERDRAIERHAMSVAYWVMLAGLILVGVLMPFSARSAWEVANAALFAIVAAEVVRCATVVLSYRRGWHG